MTRDRWGSVDYDTSGSGGLWGSIKRAFGGSDNPMSWGLPLYRLAGIRVRVHFLFLVYIAVEMLRASFGGSALFMGMTFATLFALVLLHEYGHCFACRWVGGQADEIMLWPLGGLAFCRPPHRWQAELITVVGGPMVNVILFPLLFLAVLLATGSWGAVLFNPFHPGAGWIEVMGFSLPVRLLWTGYYANGMLLAFNALVPMYPMDAGRIVQSVLWARLGYRRSMEIALVVGLAAAACLGVVGIVFNQTLLLAIAIFGGITCYMERRHLRLIGQGLFVEHEFSAESASRPTKADLRRQRREREHFQRVEQILDKISREGMGSLTRAERRTLKAETRRKRGS